VTSGVLNNSFGAGFDMGSAVTYVDLAMQFAITPQPPAAYGAADTGIKAGVYVDANTNLAVYHGLAAADGTWTGNTVHAMSWLDTNVWHRLTVALDATLTGSASRVAMFQVRIDGAPVASPAAYADNWKAQLNATGLLPATAPGGTWFRAATAGSDVRTLKALCFEGAGGADDVVVTTTNPFAAVYRSMVLIVQ